MSDLPKSSLLRGTSGPGSTEALHGGAADPTPTAPANPPSGPDHIGRQFAAGPIISAHVHAPGTQPPAEGSDAGAHAPPSNSGLRVPQISPTGLGLNETVEALMQSAALQAENRYLRDTVESLQKDKNALQARLDHAYQHQARLEMQNPMNGAGIATGPDPVLIEGAAGHVAGVGVGVGVQGTYPFSNRHFTPDATGTAGEGPFEPEPALPPVPAHLWAHFPPNSPASTAGPTSGIDANQPHAPVTISARRRPETFPEIELRAVLQNGYPKRALYEADEFRRRVAESISRSEAIETTAAQRAHLGRNWDRVDVRRMKRECIVDVNNTPINLDYADRLRDELYRQGMLGKDAGADFEDAVRFIESEVPEFTICPRSGRHRSWKAIAYFRGYLHTKGWYEDNTKAVRAAKRAAKEGADGEDEEDDEDEGSVEGSAVKKIVSEKGVAEQNASAEGAGREDLGGGPEQDARTEGATVFGTFPRLPSLTASPSTASSSAAVGSTSATGGLGGDRPVSGEAGDASTKSAHFAPTSDFAPTSTFPVEREGARLESTASTRTASEAHSESEVPIRRSKRAKGLKKDLSENALAGVDSSVDESR